MGAADELARALAAVLESAIANIAVRPTHEQWRLLTAREAARTLGRSESWLRQRTARGDIPYVRLDAGSRMYRLCDLEEYAQRHVVGGERLSALEADRPARTRNRAHQPARLRLKQSPPNPTN
jgi:hypothetical protein